MCYATPCQQRRCLRIKEREVNMGWYHTKCEECGKEILVWKKQKRRYCDDCRKKRRATRRKQKGCATAVFLQQAQWYAETQGQKLSIHNVISSFCHHNGTYTTTKDDDGNEICCKCRKPLAKWLITADAIRRQGLRCAPFQPCTNDKRCTNAHFSSTPLLLYSVCYRALILRKWMF